VLKARSDVNVFYKIMGYHRISLPGKRRCYETADIEILSDNSTHVTFIPVSGRRLVVKLPSVLRIYAVLITAVLRKFS